MTEHIVADGQLGFGIETSSLWSMFMHNILREKVLVIGLKLLLNSALSSLLRTLGFVMFFPFDNICLELRSLLVKDFCLTVP